MQFRYDDMTIAVNIPTRTALEAADFASTRGDFKFAANHHPIQTIYMREVVKEGDVVTNRIVGPAIENHQDPHGAECKM